MHFYVVALKEPQSSRLPKGIN